MRSLSVRLLLSFLVLITASSALAHDVTLNGTSSFASLDGSSSDHDGVANGVFTVDDGNLVVNGTVNCNDDGPGNNSACAMAFDVSGNLTLNGGGAFYAENRNASGTGGAIALTVGGNLALNGNAIISSAAKTSASGDGGVITANVTGNVTLSSNSTIDAGSAKATGGAITIAAGGVVSVAGKVLSGPSRTILASKLTGAVLDGGNPNQQGGAITISSTTFVEPAISVTSTANIVSQGQKDGAGPVTLDGCGVSVNGLVAAVSIEDSPATVVIRSGKAIAIDGRDLGAAGTRQGRVRADALEDGADNDGVDLFARGSVTVLGPASGSLFAVSSVPGAKASADGSGTIRVISLEDSAVASGRAFIAGADAKGTDGGAISIEAANDVNLDGATLVATGDYSKPKKQSAGGDITARSYSGDVLWRNGVGDVRPVGSTASVPPSDQGTITLTACGSVDTTGSTFPANGVHTGVFPTSSTGVCSPAAPSLPAGAPPLVTCNTPPVANDTSATTNEDNTVTVNLSGSDVDGDSLTFSIVSGPANGTLGAVISTGPTTATVDYTPSLNFNGSDSFVFQANDGNGGTDDATATITVNAVNDPPSFLAGPTVTVLEDSGAQTHANWATSISAGPADESGQTVTFTVTNDNNALFSVQPSVDSTGTLTFTPAANASGSANITLTAQDDGGTANGGNDTSASQTSAITVTPVNDEPSFTGGGNVAVGEDSGAYSAVWASAISAGPNEGSQTVTFVVSNDDNALFAAQPAVDGSGALTFTPAANANGSATVSVYAMDDGGTANGGDDTSAAQTFTISVSTVNDAPSFTSGGDVTVLEDSGAYSAPWATAISAGPADENGQTVSFAVSNDNNALFAAQPSIGPSGTLSFILDPQTFGSAIVTVTLSDNGGTANGGVDTSAPQTFTLTVTAVNDEPSFIAGGDVTVNEDSGTYSASWATGISAGYGESQTLTFVVSNDNNALFASQPAIDAGGVLTFTPAADANGTATVTVYLMDDGGTANGGDDTSDSVTFTITVNSVNDAPSFTGGGDVTVDEDSGAYSAAWATAVSAGPANESGQTLTFNITGNSNPALFAGAPALDSAGVLSFTLAANTSGSATITVTLSDNGGTANGGVDTSAPQSFTITVNAVNDAPSFTPGGNVTVNEDSGAYSASWATAISAGPNEGGQTVAFNTSNDNNALFSVQPSIDAAGVLTFTPAPNAFGTATVSVYAQDNGGTANGGVDTSATVNFVITVNGVNDPPAAGNDAWETEGNTELRVDNIPSILPYVGDTTTSGFGVRDNDADTVEGDPFLVTGVVGCADTTAPFDCAVTGGTLSLADTGYFSFKPAPGATAASFQYVITDQPSAGAPASSTGTVAITIHDMIWYVNGSAPAGGNGTSSAPFNNFASLNGIGDVDGPGAYIFVHSSNVTGSISLEASQKLWGQGIGLVIPRNLNGNGFPATLAGASSRPNVSSTGDTVSVTAVTGVEVAGLNLSSSAGNAIDVTSAPFGGAASATIYSNEVLSAGAEGIDVNGQSAAGTSVSIDTTSVTSNGNGVDVLGAAGTVVFSYSNGTITSVGGNALVVDGTTADTLLINGLSNVTISGNTAGNGVSITAAAFDANAGTAAFDTVNAGTLNVGVSGNPVGGHAVSMNNVSGDLAFSALNAYASTSGVTIAGSGLFTGAAGMRVSNGGGAISAPAGVGLSVTNSTIGAANLTFTSISSTGSMNGILLNNTGTAGGLKVLGTGSANSGGTIQNTAGAGVVATNSAHLSLSWMGIVNPGATGIDATDLRGTSSVNDSAVTQFNAVNADGLRWINTNANGSLTISGSTFSNAPTGNDGVFAEARGTSNMDLVVNQNSQFTGLFGDGVQMNTIVGASGAVNVSIHDSTFANAAPNGNGGIALAPFGGPTNFTFSILRNVMDDLGRPVTAGGIINVTAGDLDGGGPAVIGTVDDNDIVRGNGRRAINMIADTFTTLFDVTISNNDIDRLTKGAIVVDVRNQAVGKLRVTSNRLGQMAGFVGQLGFNEEAIRIQTQNNASMQTQVDSNVVTASANFETIRVRAIGTSSQSATVTNNTISDIVGSHLEIVAVTAGPVGVGPTMCFNVSGNVLPASGAGVIQLNEGAGTTLNVTQASTAAVSAANSGATVTQVGTPQYGVPACALP